MEWGYSSSRQQHFGFTSSRKLMVMRNIQEYIGLGCIFKHCVSLKLKAKLNWIVEWHSLFLPHSFCDLIYSFLNHLPRVGSTWHNTSFYSVPLGNFKQWVSQLWLWPWLNEENIDVKTLETISVLWMFCRHIKNYYHR